ncbi:MAG: ACT domain-containing protein [Pseudomonadota bacterium]
MNQKFQNLSDNLTNVRTWFADEVNLGASPDKIHDEYASHLDKLLTHLFPQSFTHDVAIVALGGYGRREITPYTDIDLLFLHSGVEGKKLEELTRAILYPLWDNQLQASIVTRTIADCELIMRKEVKAFTAMLEGRFILGNKDLFYSMSETLSSNFDDRKKRRHFIESKIREREKRLGRFAVSQYLLQPNLKEGEGGLRDYHTLLWAALSYEPFLSPKDLIDSLPLPRSAKNGLIESIKFLWRLRQLLQSTESKREDRLSFERQSNLAQRLGTERAGMMGEYYRHTSNISWLCDAVLDRFLYIDSLKSRIYAFLPKFSWKGIRVTDHQIDIIDEGKFTTSKELIDLFNYAKDHGLKFSVESELFLSSQADLFSQSDKNIITLFSSPVGLPNLIYMMRRTNILSKIFPDFEGLLYLLEGGEYHYHTTDVHSIRAIEAFDEILSKKGKINNSLALALDCVSNLRVLTLAIFLHDVGKGHGGKHEEVGSSIAYETALRLGYSEKEAGNVKWLVASHLLMPRLAFHRDVYDTHLVENFAESIGTDERLAMLYILSYCDLKAIGPHVLTSWKESLLADLYFVTWKHLSFGFKNPVRLKNSILKHHKNLKKLAEPILSKEIVEDHIANMPDSYWLRYSPNEILKHLKLIDALKIIPVAVEKRDMEGSPWCEVIVAANDFPGLFSRLTSTLASFGINILEAQLLSIGKGIALDILKLEGHGKDWPDLSDAISKQLISPDADHEIIKKRLRKGKRGDVAKVTFDNDVTHDETVMEIHVQDRPGLLYTISTLLHTQGCSIRTARISTTIDQAVDIFYIQSRHGSKLTPDELKRIEKVLIEGV